MPDRYLLYVDILGFRELVATSPERIDDLYQIFASLNAQSHSAFATLAFSDTLLVHSLFDPRSADDRSYAVMYQCEFYKDLLHRLTGRDIHVRGVLVHGSLEHYRLNETPYYHGQALITAYDIEKTMPFVGLVMDEHCRQYSTIFPTLPAGGDLNFTFVTQALTEFEDTYQAIVPLPEIVVRDTDLGWYLGVELEHLAVQYRHSLNHPSMRVRNKHALTVAWYRRRYPRLFSALEPHAFAMEAVSPHFDWPAVRKRLAEAYDWGSVRAAARAGAHRAREL